MLSLILLIVLLIMFSIFRISLLSEFNFLTTFAHNICLNQLPNLSQTSAELQALVCGEEFHLRSQTALYVNSGLIHLFVVSGAHLVVIESFLQQLISEQRSFKIYIFFLLYAYGFMCALNPPIMRCLISLSLNYFLYRRNIRWPFGYRIFVSGLVCLLVNPDWITSLSLQMSWLAAFSVSIAGEHLRHSGMLRQQILFYFALLPCLLFLQTPSPAVIATNLLFAPLLEFILFPLGLCSVVLPFLGTIFERFILLLKHILQLCEFNELSSSGLQSEHRTSLIWCFLIVAHLLEQFYSTHKKRVGN